MEPYESWQNLTKLYADKSDEELLELREDFEDLTDTAKGVLRDELRKRNQWSDKKPSEQTVESTPLPSDLSESELQDYIRMGGITVGEYETSKEAGLNAYVLELANIKNAVTRNRSSFYVLWAQLRVAAEDAERARAILAQPISDSIRQDYQAQCDAGDFITPVCKQCSAPDPLLESIDPTNQWSCEECGAEWQDPLPPQVVTKTL